NIYVDDVITGCTSESDAIQYYNESNQLMSSCGFNLRSWSSNNNEIRKLARNDNKLKTAPDVGILGIQWNTEKDTLTYRDINIQSPGHLITKRDVVSHTASLYDPLGLLSPVHVKAKLFIQDIWKKRIDWDEPLNETMFNNWESIAGDLNQITNTTMNRQYFNETTDDTNDCELHVFSDASMKAYGAVVYLRKNNKTAIVMAKTRVAPINCKTLTLPRLELMAALVATR
ncbi:uncharacterized protein LOC144358795, partial [Saccoglossus kowalevskii]